VWSLNEAALQVAFTRDGQGLLGVSKERAFMRHAPPLAQLQFDWLAESPDSGSSNRGHTKRILKQ
jgi:hypothetical protein